MGNLSLQQISKVGAAEQARSNIIAKVEEATSVMEIISQENPELKAVEEKVIKILKGPNFADDAENLAGLDPATLVKLIDITKTNNETAALNSKGCSYQNRKDPVEICRSIMK